MLYFENDYSAGAHPKVLQRLIETNMEPMSGYGTDPYSESAREKIREACGCDDADVFFLVGGTQANAVVISSLLKNYEGVVAADTGHINVHEGGAIEHTGHKVLTIPHRDGKIPPAELGRFLAAFYADPNHEHMVFPGMVYISHPTEFGTLYTKDELTEISALCRKYEIPLFMDGARLGYGLASPDSDLTLTDVARLCDVFYIGGTKVGALCGEAVVFTRNTPPHFITTIKQNGALLAKGRLTGVQFDVLFTDNLYAEISAHAIKTAEQLKTAFREKGYQFAWDSPTNQQFIVLDDATAERMKNDVVYCFWERLEENRIVARFATSWATDPDDIEKLKKIL